MSQHLHDQAKRERREMRGANTLGWLVGPAIVVAIVVVASGCAVPDVQASKSTAAKASALKTPPLAPGLGPSSRQPADAATG